MFKFLSLAAIVLTATSLAARPDSHAPIGVMGDHTHRKGEWMTSYRYMTMSMGPNYDGSARVNISDIHADFMVAPLSMDMDMHMVGVMYAPSDKLTLMGMLNYTDITMDHRVRNGREFTTTSRGLGDTGLAALYSLIYSETHRLHLNLGLSLPTGEIDVTDATPMGPNSVLPYPMRLGSGTFDVKPGLTWTYLGEAWSTGAQATNTIRLDENNRDYALGDRFDFTTWVAAHLTDSISMSARVAYANWDHISGADARLNPMMVPTARTDLGGGAETTVLFGLNYELPAGALKGHRLAIEYGTVIDRDLDGPQLGTDDVLTLGWQRAF